MNRDDWTPSDEMLIAFERGQLDDAEIQAVAHWLENHPEAEARLEQLTDSQPDDAVEALRKPCDIADEISQLSNLSASVVARSLQSPLNEMNPSSLAPIRDYILVKELGRGAMGTVYLARHQKLQRDVAIKVLAPELASDAAFAGRFEREMAVVGQMDHPNLVRAYDAGRDGQRMFLVMELLEGMDAGQLVRSRGPLPMATACAIIRQAAAGLQIAHERGLVHRDVKPSNIFVGNNGVVKVIDLGLARVNDRRLNVMDVSTVNTVLGTPDFMAPEQWTGAAIDGRADVYSLGCTLFMLLAGERVFSTTKSSDSWVTLMDAHRFQPPRSLSECRPDAPLALVELVKRMLAKDPDHRPASAQEVVELLHQFENADAGEALRTKPAQLANANAETKKRRHALVAGVLSLALLVGGLWSFKHRFRIVDSDDSSLPVNSVADQSASFPSVFTNSIGMSFSKVPKGTSWLGGGGGRPGDREVTIPRDFYLGTYEVTQADWQRVMGGNPSSFSRTGKRKVEVANTSDAELKRLPVESVSWHAVQQFLSALNRSEPSSEWTYRLPTVVEWEYACRGGPMSNPQASTFTFYLDPPGNQLMPNQAKFQCPDGGPCRVGSYMPNRLGLHDMYGNIYEWCDDAGKIRVGLLGRLVRGGAYWMEAGQLNSGVALQPLDAYHDVGFRLARVPVPKVPRSTDPMAWKKEVASLPPARQITAVDQLMRERNPTFYDKIVAKINGDSVAELTFISDNVLDLEPIRAMTGLRDLRCAGGGGSRGNLADLRPLQGMALLQLDCRESLVADLTPLTGMPLQSLWCGSSLVADLSPLANMQLRELDCSGTPVADLTPLQRLPLAELNCENTLVEDLTPASQMKQLVTLRCRGSRVRNLEPLRGLNLRHVTCDFQSQRDASVLKSIATLQTINGKPVAEFWKENSGH